jgi:hypothetical protein
MYVGNICVLIYQGKSKKGPLKSISSFDDSKLMGLVTRPVPQQQHIFEYKMAGLGKHETLETKIAHHFKKQTSAYLFQLKHMCDTSMLWCAPKHDTATTI